MFGKGSEKSYTRVGFLLETPIEVRKKKTLAVQGL